MQQVLSCRLGDADERLRCAYRRMLLRQMNPPPWPAAVAFVNKIVHRHDGWHARIRWQPVVTGVKHRGSLRQSASSVSLQKPGCTAQYRRTRPQSGGLLPGGDLKRQRGALTLQLQTVQQLMKIDADAPMLLKGKDDSVNANFTHAYSNAFNIDV